MDQTLRFGAPRSARRRQESILLCVLAAMFAALGLFVGRNIGSAVLMASPVLFALIALGGALCAVRGYVLSDEFLTIRRLGWESQFALRELQQVAGDSEALLRAWRILSVGGLFSYTGIYWSRTLGRFRVYANDPARSVVLYFTHGKVVITPDDPQRFILRTRTILRNREL